MVIADARREVGAHTEVYLAVGEGGAALEPGHGIAVRGRVDAAGTSACTGKREIGVS